MSRKSDDNRWESTFAQFVTSYGVDKLAKKLRVHSSAVYHWLRGKTSPHPAKAVTIQRLAKRRGIVLSLDEIYEHSKRFTTAPVGRRGWNPPKQKPQHARSL